MQSKKESPNASYRNSFEETIPNDESDDIIECSIVENEMQNKFKCKQIYETKSKGCTVLSEKIEISAKKHNFCKSQNINTSLRFTLKKSYESKDEGSAEDEKKKFIDIVTPQKDVTSCEKADTVYKRVLSSLTKRPEDIPHLSKSKLQNIQRWLQCSDFETVRTPPYANLSVTPVSVSKKRKRREQKDAESSSIDSDVEGVLKAVYGSDWMEKNVGIKCKTEPRRRLNKNFSPFPKVKPSDSVRSFKKRVLASKENNSVDADGEEKNFNLDDSIISGVRMINFDDSGSGLEVKFFKNHAKKEKTDEGFGGGNVENSPSANGKTSNVLVKPTLLKSSSSRGRPKKLANGGSVQSELPKKTFLASLSISTPNSKCHPDARHYKINFKSKKDELARKLFKLYNGEVFAGKLPDDMDFSWNVKLRGTAGFCHNKRITRSTGEVLRLSRIEFSTKIVDRADRLRDTMIHELCHAASWVIDGTLDGHGHVWSSWAAKAMARFPELPKIKRCHNYDIVSKYLYRCVDCGYAIKRHSKSINTERKRCGHCFGVLELLVNKKRKEKTEVPEFEATRTLPTPNKFALFVKENYHQVKNDLVTGKHTEIMKILSQKYALAKANAMSIGSTKENRKV